MLGSVGQAPTARVARAGAREGPSRHAPHDRWSLRPYTAQAARRLRSVRACPEPAGEAAPVRGGRARTHRLATQSRMRRSPQSRPWRTRPPARSMNAAPSGRGHSEPVPAFARGEHSLGDRYALVAYRGTRGHLQTAHARCLCGRLGSSGPRHRAQRRRPFSSASASCASRRAPFFVSSDRVVPVRRGRYYVAASTGRSDAGRVTRCSGSHASTEWRSSRSRDVGDAIDVPLFPRQSRRRGVTAHRPQLVAI